MLGAAVGERGRTGVKRHKLSQRRGPLQLRRVTITVLGIRVQVRLARPAEREEVPMPVVGGLDMHRKQLTFDYLDTVTGEVRRGSPAAAMSRSRWRGAPGGGPRELPKGRLRPVGCPVRGNRDGLWPVQDLPPGPAGEIDPAGQAARASPSGICCRCWCWVPCCGRRAVVTVHEPRQPVTGNGVCDGDM
jgi:hypothetical protein